MKKTAFVFIFFLLILPFVYAETLQVEKTVIHFSGLTDLQRVDLLKQIQGNKITASGKIKNVEEWKAYDQRTDKETLYYRVSNYPQKIYDGPVYQVHVLYKDKDKVKDLNRGEPIKAEGSLIKILDERMLFSVWIYAGELTAEDRVMLQIN